MTRSEKLENAAKLEQLLRELIEDDDEHSAKTRQYLVKVRRLIRGIERSK